MNAADSARLELAKRAFRATQPTEREVQTGVRRARLSRSRTKPRRTWFFKGLVFVVLALGSLAYAKPHALGELLERGLPTRLAGAARGHGLGSAAEAKADAESRATPSAAGSTLPVAASFSQALVAPSSAATATAVRPHLERAAKAGGRSAPSRTKPELQSAAPGAPPAEHTTAQERDEPREAVSPWGRVGQALARGDETKALAALGELADSPDPRTRDKADLGRAQLMMSHGNREQACALSRSLTQRRAGSQIERQAQVLLSECRR